MINYRMEGDIAVLHMDDGKANVVSHAFLDQMNESLDRAEKEAKAVVLLGRDQIFSGGFDLSEFAKGAEASLALVKRGFPFLQRLFSHPQPLVAASTGHGIAAGAFMILACDSRYAAAGSFKYQLPETAIGMSMPGVLHELASARITPRFLTAAVIQAKSFTPEQAVLAGFIDEVVEPEQVLSHALAEANALALLPAATYAQNKLDCRQDSLHRMQASVDDVIASKI